RRDDEARRPLARDAAGAPGAPLRRPRRADRRPPRAELPGPPPGPALPHVRRAGPRLLAGRRPARAGGGAERVAVADDPPGRAGAAPGVGALRAHPVPP